MVAIEYPELKPGNSWTEGQLLVWAMGVRGNCREKWWVRELNEILLRDVWELERQMAKAKTKKTSKKDIPFNGFVNVSLSAERKVAVKQWGKSWEEVIDLFSQLIADDYRVSFGPANDGNTVQCSVTCRDTSSLNAGWCMTSRAPKWEDALTVAMWKHYALCDRDWSEYLEGDVEDDWG